MSSFVVASEGELTAMSPLPPRACVSVAAINAAATASAATRVNVRRVV
jgi:hypothetical protein